MRRTLWLSLTLAAALLAVAAATDATAGRRASRPAGAKTILVAAADAGAKGKVDTRHWPATKRREDRSRLRLRLRKLEPEGAYTLWMDDPRTPDPSLAVATFPALLADARGRLELSYDTREGDVFPFGSTLDALAGRALHVRDDRGVSILVGAVPAGD